MFSPSCILQKQCSVHFSQVFFECIFFSLSKETLLHTIKVTSNIKSPNNIWRRICFYVLIVDKREKISEMFLFRSINDQSVWLFKYVVMLYEITYLNRCHSNSVCNVFVFVSSLFKWEMMDTSNIRYLPLFESGWWAIFTEEIPNENWTSPILLHLLLIHEWKMTLDPGVNVCAGVHQHSKRQLHVNYTQLFSCSTCFTISVIYVRFSDSKCIGNWEYE